MRRNVPKLAVIFVCLQTSLLTASVSADVYVSYDSLQPTYDQKLSSAQLQALNDLSDKISNQNDLNEFYAANIIEFQKVQQERMTAQAAELQAQRFLNEQKLQSNHEEAKALLVARASLENQRLAMLQDAKQREAQLLQQGVQQEQNFLLKQKQREDQFYSDQNNIQQQTLALQTQVAATQNQILENELRDGAPSNLIIASSDASNMKQVINPKMVDAVKSLGEAQQQNVVVNLNEFVSTILPPSWHYTAPSGLDNETINAVQGKDWQSILNLIAVNNPHLEIVVDPYKKTVTIANTIHALKTNKVNRTTPYTTWHVSTKRTIGQNIDAFAKMAKWNLVWDTQGKDYETVAPAVIKARFAGKGGVVDQLIGLTQAEEFPLEVDFKYGNKVVIVTRKGAQTK